MRTTSPSASLLRSKPSRHTATMNGKVDIFRKVLNEGKPAVPGWEGAEGIGRKRGGWSKDLPGASRAVSAKAERKRARQEAATEALEKMPRARSVAEVAGPAAMQEAEAPRASKRRKHAAAEDTEDADDGFAEETEAPCLIGPAPAVPIALEKSRVVSLVQPESVRTAQGGFPKGHMAALKATLEAAGEIAYLNVVPDSLEVHVVYTEATSAKRAIKIDGVGTLRRLKSSEASAFFAEQSAKAEAARANKEAQVEAAAARRAAAKGKGKGKGKGGGKGRGKADDERDGKGSGGKGKGFGKGGGKGKGGRGRGADSRRGAVDFL